MTEATQDQGTVKSAPVTENRTFQELLKSLIGHVVTIVNPESYEDAPVGHQIRAGFYRAKPIGMGQDYLIVATEFTHSAGGAAAQSKEPVRQYIPVSQIKRISILKTERLIHI
jgi:hypothetical protein